MSDADLDAILDASFNKSSDTTASSSTSSTSTTNGTHHENGHSSSSPTTKEPLDLKRHSSSSSSSSSKEYDRDKGYDRDYRDSRDSRDYRDSRDSRGYRDRDGYYKDSRDRDYYRDRDYHSRDRDRDRDDGYSSSRDRDYYSRDRDGYHGGGRGRDYYSSRSSHGGGGRRDRPYERRERPRTPPQPVEDPALPELTPEQEEEMDLRTAFITNLAPEIQESELYKFFEQAGEVIKVSLVIDKVTKKFKGVGYVEFKEKEMVDRAVTLTGQLVGGVPIAVHAIQPEKKTVKITGAGVPVTSTNTPSATGNCRLYVGFLNLGMSEDQIRSLFTSYGDLDFINIHIKPGLYKYAFVQFKRPESAALALEKVNGLEVFGKPLKVTMVSEEKNKQPGTATHSITPLQHQQNKILQQQLLANPALQQQLFQQLTQQNLIQTPQYYQQQQPHHHQPYAQKMGSLDEEEGSIPLNAQAKALLTAKLQGIHIEPKPTPITVTPVNGAPISFVPQQSAPATQPPVVATSTCLVLKNMFDPETESGENWDIEIQREVQEECSNFGNIKHIYLDRFSQGYVYLRYESIEGASAAINKLNRRWFSGKMLSAESIPEASYKLKFPNAF